MSALDTNHIIHYSLFTIHYSLFIFNFHITSKHLIRQALQFFSKTVLTKFRKDDKIYLMRI